MAKKKVSKKVVKKIVTDQATIPIQSAKLDEIGDIISLEEGEVASEELFFLGNCVQTGKRLYKKLK